MKTIKIFLFKRFKILFPLFALTFLCIFLLSIRLKITHSYFYLFLVWNLFLAMIPFFISMYAKSVKNLKKVKLYFLSIVWLLFLPNAPYLLTDFIHLRLSPPEWIAFDSLMITAFAITGITFYAPSIKEMETVFLKNFNEKIVSKFIAILPFLVSFGMFLGRVLRWNSWDILHKPLSIFTDVFSIVLNPFVNIDAWLFTILVGLFLKLYYWCSKKYLFSFIEG